MTEWSKRASSLTRLAIGQLDIGRLLVGHILLSFELCVGLFWACSYLSHRQKGAGPYVQAHLSLYLHHIC